MITYGTHEFTFPYMLAGKIAAEFEARCHFRASTGRPAQLYGPPENCYPAEGGEVTDIDDIEIDVGSFDRETKRHVAEWVKPDEALRDRIEAWLWDSDDELDRMLEAAEEDAADAWCDYCDRKYDEWRDAQMERRWEEEARP